MRACGMAECKGVEMMLEELLGGSQGLCVGASARGDARAGWLVQACLKLLPDAGASHELCARTRQEPAPAKEPQKSPTKSKRALLRAKEPC